MNDRQVEELLEEALQIFMDDGNTDPVLNDFVTFSEAGVLTMNRGLVLTFANGQQFQITIVRSR